MFLFPTLLNAFFYSTFVTLQWSLLYEVSNIVIGLPVKPLVYVERVYVPLEQLYKYVSDESTDTEDEEWTLGPKKEKKQKKDVPVNPGK